MLKTPRLVELPYHEDSATRFDAFAGRPWCVLLDSDRQRQQQGRFDIFAADPYLTLTTRGGKTEIQSGGKTKITDADPFALLKEHLGGTLPGHPALPFTCGALGYFAYDLGRRVEHLPEIAIDDIALPDMAIGLYERCVVVDHLDRRTWFVSRAVGQEMDGFIANPQGPAALRLNRNVEALRRGGPAPCARLAEGAPIAPPPAR